MKAIREKTNQIKVMTIFRELNEISRDFFVVVAKGFNGDMKGGRLHQMSTAFEFCVNSVVNTI